VRKTAIALLAAGTLTAAVTGTIVAAVPQTPERPLCRGVKGETYSPGAYIRHENQVYGCFPVFGNGLTSAGVAWIRMQETFTPAH